MSRPRGLFSHIFRNVGKAIKEFRMIDDGDTVYVGISGGKDSYLLAYVLATLRTRAPIEFAIKAVHVKLTDEDVLTDSGREFLNSLGIPLTEIPTNIHRIVRIKGEGCDRCALCARMRRGALYSHIIKEMGSPPEKTKLALGHHQDDFNETLLMNMFIHGRIKGMQAHYVSSYGIHVIRPLVFVAEDKIEEFFPRLGIELREFNCPFKPQNRQLFKNLIRSLKSHIPSVSRNLLIAQKNVLISTLLASHSIPVFDEGSDDNNDTSSL